MLKKLDSPPKDKSIYYLQADYVELLCLVNRDKVIAQEEIQNRYIEYADIDKEPQEDEQDEDEQELDEAEISDRLSSRLDDLLRNLKYRENAFGESYPFLIDAGLSQIAVKSRLTDHHKLYVYLLMASCLRHFKKSVESPITKSFESISAEALRQYIGSKAEVHIFGANVSSRYTGNKSARIRQLAEDICERLRDSKDRFSPNDSADAGLDIVAWFPFADKTPGRFLVFGQCTCRKDWENKQHSSGYDRWSRLIDLSIRPLNTIFIPYCFRDSNGDWYQENRIYMSLMIDRLRIMKLLSTVESPLSDLPSEIHDLIEDTLSYVEEL